MNTFLKRLLLIAGLFFFVIANVFAVHVKGYYRKDGTYVRPHERTAPNKTKNDNYSTKGNVNPYTGKAGTKPRDEESQPKSSTTPQNDSPPVAKPDAGKAPDSTVTGWAAIKSGMSDKELMRQIGVPRVVEGKKDYEVWTYPTGTVYVKDRKVVAWKQVKAP